MNSHRVFCLLLLLINVFCANAQEETDLPYIQEGATFPNGEDSMYAFMSHNFIYPDYCIQNNIGGRVIIKFAVLQTGQVSNVSVLGSPHELITKECIRLMQFMPKWNPAKINGIPVGVYYSIPLVLEPNTQFYSKTYLLPKKDSNLSAKEELRQKINDQLDSIENNLILYNYLTSPRPIFLFIDTIRNFIANETFISTNKHVFEVASKKLDSLLNTVNDTLFCLNDSLLVARINKQKWYTERELKCLKRFEGFSSFRRYQEQYRPLYANWYMNDSFTRKYDAGYLEAKIPVCLYTDLPSYHFAIDDIKKTGIYSSFNIGIGYYSKRYLFKVYLHLLFGNNPNYMVIQSNQNTKVNASDAAGYGFEIDYKWYSKKNYSSFFVGALGYSKLNQYFDQNTKQVIVSSSSPVYTLGHIITYRPKPYYYISLNTHLHYIQFQSNTGTNLSGLLLQIGIGFGFGGNNCW